MNSKIKIYTLLIAAGVHFSACSSSIKSEFDDTAEKISRITAEGKQNWIEEVKVVILEHPRRSEIVEENREPPIPFGAGLIFDFCFNEQLPKIYSDNLIEWALSNKKELGFDLFEIYPHWGKERTGN